MPNAKSMIETISSVLSTAESTFSGMPEKGRIQLKELAQTVAAATGIEVKDALTFVTYFARNTDLGYVSRGKNGGLIRGSRPIKPMPKESVPMSTVSDDVDSDDNSSSSEEEEE